MSKKALQHTTEWPTRGRKILRSKTLKLATLTLWLYNQDENHLKLQPKTFGSEWDEWVHSNVGTNEDYPTSSSQSALSDQKSHFWVKLLKC